MMTDSNSPDSRTSKRFLNENLRAHWRVDDTRESFERLLHHLEVVSNFKPYFEEAMNRLNLDDEKFPKGLIVADIGAGIGWTSAMLARHPNVKRVYSVDPSGNRLKYCRSVARHFRVEDSVEIINGTYIEPNIPEKVDIVLLCGSLHHCYDGHIAELFSNIKQLLKPGGKVMIANDHYVDWRWGMKRLMGCIYHFRDRERLYYSFKNPRAPDPFGGEHWRTRKELEEIFKNNGLKAEFFIHKGDLCKDKHSPYRRMGWFYYHAVLSLEKETDV